MLAHDIALGRAVLRIALGFNFLMHGVSRLLSGVDAFARGMAKGFEPTVLPTQLAYAFAWPLPFVELALGVLLTLGLFTRQALIATAVLLLLLTFGVALQAKWDVVGSQLVYQLVVAALLCTSSYEAYSLDRRRARRR